MNLLANFFIDVSEASLDTVQKACFGFFLDEAECPKSLLK